MKTIQTKISDFLEIDGWEIDNMETEDLEWWADEIWNLKSKWSPKDSMAYLTFLVDPETNVHTRKKEQDVWGVGVSKEYPTSRVHAGSIGTISLRSVNKQGLEELSEYLESIRK